MSYFERDNAPHFSSEDDWNSQPARKGNVPRSEKQSTPFHNGRRRHHHYQKNVLDGEGNVPSELIPGGDNEFFRDRRLEREARRASSLGLGESLGGADTGGSKEDNVQGIVGDWERGNENPLPQNTTATVNAFLISDRGEEALLAKFGDDDSESTGSKQASPSPAARDRKIPVKGWNSSSSSPTNAALDPVLAAADKRRIQMEKDRMRMNRMKASGTGIWSRADLGPRVLEAATVLARQNNTSSVEEDEAPRGPRPQWAARADKRAALIKKLLAPAVQINASQPATGEKDKQRSSMDVPVPSIEVEYPMQEPTLPLSRLSSAQPLDASPERSRAWEADLDFTAQSLQLSTSPQLRLRSQKLDEVRNREIQSLSSRAVATSRLEEIRERNSEERSILKSSLQPSVERLVPSQVDEPSEQKHNRTIIIEDEVSPRNSPVTGFRKETYRDDSSSRERNPHHERGSSASSRHARDESREILRKLSRALSASPAPPRQTGINDQAVNVDEDTVTKKVFEGALEQPTERFTESPVDRSSKKPVENPSGVSNIDVMKSNMLNISLHPKQNSRPSSPPKSDVDPEERITAEARLFELQDNKSERNSIRAPSPSPSPPSEMRFDETPKPVANPNPLSLPTPKVTGAYIETPAPNFQIPRKSRSVSPSLRIINTVLPALNNITRPRSYSHSSTSLEEERQTSGKTLSQRGYRRSEQSPRKLQIRPVLKNTAKTSTASEDLRQIQRESQVDDSTLDDFDAILEEDAKNTINATTLSPLSDRGRDLPLSKKEQERRLETLVLDRMNKHLKNTSSSIRDARQGIERLEHQVSSSHTSQSNPIPEEEGYVNIKVPFPRLWISEPIPAYKKGHNQDFPQRNWRFTWLGFVLSLFLCWYIVESTVCGIYCHPKQSLHNTWQPSDPFFPWAVPTKLDQWTGEVVSKSFESMMDALDGIFEPRNGKLNNTGWNGSRVASMGASDWWLGRDGPLEIVRSSDYNDGSIFSDEVI